MKQPNKNKVFESCIIL